MPTGLPAERTGPLLLIQAPTLRSLRSNIALNRHSLQGLAWGDEMPPVAAPPLPRLEPDE